MTLIQQLLRNPGVEIRAVALVGGEVDEGGEGQSIGMPAIDQDRKNQLQARLRALNHQRLDAEQRHDLNALERCSSEVEALQQEAEQIQQHLAANTWRGRPRLIVVAPLGK